MVHGANASAEDIELEDLLEEEQGQQNDGAVAATTVFGHTDNDSNSNNTSAEPRVVVTLGAQRGAGRPGLNDESYLIGYSDDDEA